LLPEPLLLSCSEIDHTFDVEGRREALDILQREKKVYQYQLFSGVEHGFALRGNMENAYERE
jgi:dienelactone hydrolase